MTKSQEENLLKSFALIQISQEDAKTLIGSLAFIFREKKRILNHYAEKTKKRIDNLKSSEEVFIETSNGIEISDEIATDITDLFTSLFRHFKILDQSIIIQVSVWMQSCYRYYIPLLVHFRGESADFWKNKFYNLGPRIKPGYFWAEAIRVASNCVRHKEEWEFESLKYNKQQNKMEKNRKIVSTLKNPKARRNVQYLIEIGVSESEIFNSTLDLSARVLNISKTYERKQLQNACNDWIKEVNSYARETLFEK